MDMEAETDMETEKENTRTWTWTWGGDAVGPGIWELLLSISYGAIVPIAPNGTLLKYHGAISNGAIYV
jgi:hypothetical protein